MGNSSPQPSKSCHDGFVNHRALSVGASSLTPGRSSWKKQLEIINKTFNLKRFSLRSTNGKQKRTRSAVLGSHRGGHERMTNNDERESTMSKSFSLFSIKQPAAEATVIDKLTESDHSVKVDPSVSTRRAQSSYSLALQQTSKSLEDDSTRAPVLQHEHQSKLDLTTSESTDRLSPC